MALVTAQISLSLDGFYVGPQHVDMATWMEGPEAAGFFRVTRWVTGALAWRDAWASRAATTTSTPRSSRRRSRPPARM